KTLQLVQGLMAEAPSAAGQMLVALDFYLGPVQEFAVIGDPEENDTRRVLRAVHGHFRPNKVVAGKSPSQDGAPDEVIALLAEKKSLGSVTTYICQNFTCQAPLVGPEAAEKALG